jgi:hypothetical protein
MSRAQATIRNSFWNDERWPRDAADGSFVFLGRALTKVGRARFSDWTDDAALKFYAGVNRPTNRIVEEAMNELGDAIACGKVGFALRAPEGGAFKMPREMDRSSHFGATEWNVDDYRPLFKFAQMSDGHFRFETRPGKDWIFVERASLDRFIAGEEDIGRGDMASSIKRLSEEVGAGIASTSAISLFEAAVLLAKRISKNGQPETGDLFDLGAQELLSKLQKGDVEATGINAQTRLREPITPQHWECATYDISGYGTRQQHHVDFLDMHRPDEGGFGGSLTLAGAAKPAWIYITVPASIVADNPAEATREESTLPKLTAGQQDIRWAIERLRQSPGGLPSKAADRDSAIQATLKNGGRRKQTPRSIQEYLRLERSYPSVKNE